VKAFLQIVQAVNSNNLIFSMLHAITLVLKILMNHLLTIVKLVHQIASHVKEAPHIVQAVQISLLSFIIPHVTVNVPLEQIKLVLLSVL